jgi:biopolymer transport protein ExbB
LWISQIALQVAGRQSLEASNDAARKLAAASFFGVKSPATPQKKQRPNELFAIIQAAGWPIWPLLLASVIALALIIERFVSLRDRKILPPLLLEEVVAVYQRQGVTDDMLAKLAKDSPLGTVLAAGLRNHRSSRYVMKDAIDESGRAVAHDLERFLTTLGTIATAAPLLGLFGTVIGMIEIFGSQSPSGANPQQLAHGISVALYNTAFGIAIAIPALIFYRHFKNKVDTQVVEMEQQATRLIDIVHGERMDFQAPQQRA